jgi:transcriptional regulator with XRE-family HTH domain
MESPLHERMRAVVGARTYKTVSDLTATNAETVRRYLQGQSPSVEFLAALASALEINGEWLLCGRGAMRRGEVKAHALREASGAELLGALATTVEKLSSRVERLEVYMQVIEARMRGMSAPAGGSGPGVGETRHSERTHEQEAIEGGSGSEGAAPGARRRARRIADAVADGPPADAR